MPLSRCAKGRNERMRLMVLHPLKRIGWQMTSHDARWRDMIWHDMRCDMMWCAMIWYDMTWYDMIWYVAWHDMTCEFYDMTMIWYDMTWQWYDMIWYDMIWYDMISYDMRHYVIWYDMIWYDMIWYDMIWYDMTCGMTWRWYAMIWHDDGTIWYMTWRWYDMTWHDNDMIWYDVKMIWHDNDTIWYDMLILWYDNDMIWYDMTWQSYDMIRHDSYMIWYDNDMPWHDNMIWDEMICWCRCHTQSSHASQYGTNDGLRALLPHSFCYQYLPYGDLRVPMGVQHTIWTITPVCTLFVLLVLGRGPSRWYADLHCIDNNNHSWRIVSGEMTYALKRMLVKTTHGYHLNWGKSKTRAEGRVKNDTPTVLDHTKGGINCHPRLRVYTCSVQRILAWLKLGYLQKSLCAACATDMYLQFHERLQQTCQTCQEWGPDCPLFINYNAQTRPHRLKVMYDKALLPQKCRGLVNVFADFVQMWTGIKIDRREHIWKRGDPLPSLLCLRKPMLHTDVAHCLCHSSDACAVRVYLSVIASGVICHAVRCRFTWNEAQLLGHWDTAVMAWYYGQVQLIEEGMCK